MADRVLAWTHHGDVFCPRCAFELWGVKAWVPPLPTGLGVIFFSATTLICGGCLQEIT